MLRWKYTWVLSIAFLSAALLSGCGSSNDGNGVNGINNGLGGFAPGGCAPISAPIGFSSIPGSGTYVDSASIVAGTLMAPFPSQYFQGGPYPSTQYGQLTVGSGGAGGQYHKTGASGQVSLNLITNGCGPYGSCGGSGGSGNTGNTQIQGSIILNSQTVSNIYAQFGGMFGGGGSYPNQQASICVNQMGIDFGYSQSSQTVWGMVYLYINGQGIPLAF